MEPLSLSIQDTFWGKIIIADSILIEGGDFISGVVFLTPALSDADPEIFHGGWLSGWLSVPYYTELWGVVGKQ